MKKLFIILFLIPMVLSGREYTILSYNIQHGEGLDEQVDLLRIADVIRDEAPFVACIQELDSCAKRTDYHNQLQELAEATKMYPCFAPAIDFQGGRYGVGILCSEKPISVRHIPLPDRHEPRVLLMVEFETFIMACTHLPLTEEDRMKSLPLIVENAEASSKPFLLAGDWNDEPGSPFIQAMGEKFRFCSDIQYLSFPSDKPKVCIDYIAVSKKNGASVEVREQSIIHCPFSDHLPIAVRVNL